MKKMLLSLSVIVMTALTLSGTAHSTDLTVNFTANLRETTCDMKLVGGSGSNTEQTLKIGDSQGKIRLDQVQAGTATAEFKLAIVECPSSLSDLKTTVKGTQNTDLLTGVSNSKKRPPAAVQIMQPSPLPVHPPRTHRSPLTRPTMLSVWSGPRRKSPARKSPWWRL